eukprot:scaffold3214_cov33-Phaeocystis_antarctica.AAC.2
MYWSRTESSKWSLDSLSFHPRRPFSLDNATPSALVISEGLRSMRDVFGLPCGYLSAHNCAHFLLCDLLAYLLNYHLVNSNLYSLKCLIKLTN